MCLVGNMLDCSNIECFHHRRKLYWWPWESKFEDSSHETEDKEKRLKKNRRIIQEIKQLDNSSSSKKENAGKKINERKTSRKIPGIEWCKLPDWKSPRYCLIYPLWGKFLSNIRNPGIQRRYYSFLDRSSSMLSISKQAFDLSIVTLEAKKKTMEQYLLKSERITCNLEFCTYRLLEHFWVKSGFSR